jgi:elongation factor P
MLSMSDLKLGTVVSLNNQPYLITYTQHIKVARGSATLRTKLKNLINGSTLDKSFSGSDRIEEADLVRRKSNYLYTEDDFSFFMDAENFEQYQLPKQSLGEKINFLKDGQPVDVLLYNNEAVSVELPKKISLTVTSAPPGVKGDTSGSATKSVTLETGIDIKTPLFINSGDKLIVNTETGQYVERE